MVEFKHWVEKLVDKLTKTRSPPYIVGSGITTSGPPHLGTVCEFLYPWAIVQELRSRGYEAYFIFVGDIMDAFDSIPADLEKYKDTLKPHLGKPLALTPDPYGCHSSYGEHFLDETVKLMDTFGVKPDEIIPVTKLYNEGYYDIYLEFYTSKLDEVKRLLMEVSGRQLPKYWKDIALPICEKCGKIATTRVLNITKHEIEYICDKNVGYTKGCGYKGILPIDTHKWKLTWRLDWPSRMDFLGVDIEGAGVDHHTKGGSWDTAVAVFKRLFRKEPPIGYKYGFVLFEGRKMSKSKGVGSLNVILKMVPPEILKYFLFKNELEENKNFNTTPQFLLRLYEEFNDTADIYEKKAKIDKSTWRRLIAYKLATKGVRPWKTRITDLIVYYQIYKDWDIVVKKLNDKSGVERLKRYVEYWVENGIVPEQYRVQWNPQKITDPTYKEVVLEFARKLNNNMTAIDIHNLVYEVARKFNIPPSTLFKILYYAILGKHSGPRLGKLIVALGIDKVKQALIKSIE